MRNTVLVLLAAGLLASCQNLDQLSNGISKSLGIPVVLNADEEDACLKRQLQAFVSQVKGMTSKDRNELKAALSKFREIVLEPTEAVGELSGERSVLKYVECADRRCTDPFFMRVYQKVIEDKLEGDYPAVKITKGESLTLLVESAQAEFAQRVFETRNSAVYRYVESRGEEGFNKFLDDGVISEEDSQAISKEEYCADRIRIEDLAD